MARRARLVLEEIKPSEREALVLRFAGTWAAMKCVKDNIESTATVDGRPHDVITYTDTDGRQISLYFDAQTHLLSRREMLGVDAVFGDQVFSIQYLDYAPVGGLQLLHPSLRGRRQSSVTPARRSNAGDSQVTHGTCFCTCGASA